MEGHHTIAMSLRLFLKYFYVSKLVYINIYVYIDISPMWISLGLDIMCSSFCMISVACVIINSSEASQTVHMLNDAAVKHKLTLL
jgi:uncharacterized membrane protein